MKQFVIQLSIILSGLYLLYTVATIIANVTIENYNYIDLNLSDNSAKDWKLPKDYKLLYCASNGKYEVSINDGIEYRLWHPVFLGQTAILDKCTDKDATTFSDSTTAKYYTKLYYEHFNPKDCYKPIRQ